MASSSQASPHPDLIATPSDTAAAGTTDYTHHRGPLPKSKSKATAGHLARDGDIQKYRAKYKDLKMKVKQIEKDNDKLLLKILKAKKDIQRARLERAIIYERLSMPTEPPAPSSGSTPAPLQSYFLPPSESGVPPATASQPPAAVV